MEKIEKPGNASWPIIFWTFLFSLGYAVLRYHILGDVLWDDLPFYILNKSISMSSIILLTFNFACTPLENLGYKVGVRFLKARRLVGIMGFIQVFVHVIMSFMLFKPAVYKSFFEADGTMTLFAGLSMLGGVLAFIFTWIYNISFNSNFRKDKDLINWITSRKVLLFAMFMAGVHLFFMGFDGWMRPFDWHGGMPPISLVSFVIFMVGFIINLIGRK